MSGSSGTLTVLFTDLVGSSELMARIGEVAFDELRHEHFAGLRAALATHGGAEVKNTGDGLMATFSSAAAAVDAAVAMQQATDAHARRSPVPVAIRVGVALGDATLEDGDVFGTPVVEAARLVAAARPGQILVTAVVRIVGGGRSGAAFTDLGPLELKGLSDPVPVCEVLWEPAAGERPVVPLPPLVSGTGRIFVGRDTELERLGQLWKEASAGERRTALLGGEPGIGKTRLAAELAASLHGDGAVVLAGRCDEDLGVPYQPFVEALRHYLGHAGEPALGRHPGELVRLVPELAQLVPGLPESVRSDPETERYRLFDAVASWLADVSAAAPVLLVLDDLQWAAKPTLLLLRHVLRSAEPMHLLVMATYRDTDIGRGHPLADLLADLRRQADVARIPLGGLDGPEVASFMAAAAGHDLSEDGEALARAIWAETEGNPFFVVEVLRHLSESGALERRDGEWVTTAPLAEVSIPEGIREVVGRRLSRLSDVANRVLTCASVVGPEFEAAVVLAAGRLAEDDLFAALDEALSSRLLSEAPGARYRFSHSLVRATLYDELSAAHRVGLHRRVAEAIEALHAGRLDDHLPALAHHYSRAAAPAAETAKAVDYATRAGDRALAQLAHDEAVAYYRQALELLDAAGVAGRDDQRVPLLISLGEAQRRAGDPAHRELLLRAGHLARQRGDADALARAALANNRGFHSVAGRVDAERVDLLDAALAAIPPGDSPVRARLLASLAAELGWAPGDRRLALAAEALGMARRLADLPTLGHVLALRWTAIPPLDPLERKREVVELEEVARRLQDPALAFWAALWRVESALELGDGTCFAAALDTAAERAGELSQPVLEWCSTMPRAIQALFSGRLDEADRIAARCLEIGQAAGVPDAVNVYGSHRFWILYERGRLEELVDTLSRAAARPEPDRLSQAALALALAELGRTEEARIVIDGLAAGAFASIPSNYAAPYGLTLLAAACAGAGHAEVAPVLRDRLVPYRGLVAQVGPAAMGAVDHFLGLLALTLAELDEAEGRFRDAARIHERMGAPTWLARTRLEWARMLLRRRARGDEERAYDLLEKVLTSAIELGLGNVERRAVELLGAP